MTSRALALAIVLCLAGCSTSTTRVCDRIGPPPPNFECTAQFEGAIVCSSGSGYACTRDACWALFVDGPCAARVDDADAGSDAGAWTDGGASDAGSCGTDESCFPGQAGSERCTATTRERCESGCWRPRGTCDDGGVFICGAGGTPPVDPCTSDVEGVMVCPGGTSSGSGYRCEPTRCWIPFSDGPCSSPFMGHCFNGGTTCTAGEVGQERCVGRLRMRCGGGCFTPVGLCPRDGG